MAAANRPATEKTMKFVIELLFVRLRRGITNADVAKEVLRKTELPLILIIEAIASYGLEHYTYDGQVEKNVLEEVTSPLLWDKATKNVLDGLFASSQMVLANSAKLLREFVESLYTGGQDGNIKLLMTGGGLKSGKRAQELFLAPELMGRDVEQAYETERKQRVFEFESTMRRQQNQSATPQGAIEGEDAGSLLPDSIVVPGGEEEMPAADAETKSQRLEQQRRDHCRRALPSFAMVMNRPADKDGYHYYYLFFSAGICFLFQSDNLVN